MSHDLVSLSDLPQDDGFLPAGKWLLVLRDSFTDGMAGASFRDGITEAPIDGRLLKRIVTFMPVVGALRVEGEPCKLGDVSRIDPDYEAPAEAAEETGDADKPPTDPPDDTDPLKGPSTAAELAAMPDADVRALAATMGVTDGRLGIAKLRAFVADELGIEDA